MLPQHGGVPNFKIKLSGPTILGLSFTLVTGILIALMLFTTSDPGDLQAGNQIRFILVVTFLLCAFIFLLGTGRWWYPHLWKSQRNSQSAHRQRTGHRSGRKHHRHDHHRHSRKH